MRSVIELEMLSGDMLPLFGATSAKTGLAPQYSTAWAVATMKQPDEHVPVVWVRAGEQRMSKFNARGSPIHSMGARVKLQGGSGEVFNLFFGQFSADLSDKF